MRLKGVLPQILHLFVGRTLGQMAIFLVTPILSRLFAPTDYGTAGLVLSFATMGAIIATLRYDLKFVTLRTAAARNNLLFVCTGIVTVFSILILIVTLLWGAFFEASAFSGSVWMVLSVAPIAWTSAMFNQVLPNYVASFGNFGVISLSSIFSGAATAALQLGLGLLGLGPIALISGRLIGSIAGIAALLVPLYRARFADVMRGVTLQRMKVLAGAYRGQALLLSPSDVFNTLAAFLPVFALRWYYGSETSGFYYFMFTIAGTVMKVYSSSVRPVIIKRFSDENKAGGDLYKSAMNMTLILSIASIIAYIILYIVGLKVFLFVFGAKWEEAGLFTIATGWYYAVTIVHVPLAGLVAVLNFQRIVLVTEGAQLVVTILALLSAYLGLSALQVVWLMSIACSFVYLVSLLFILEAIRKASGRQPLDRVMSKALTTHS